MSEEQQQVEIEAKASKQGWTDKDHFKGDEAKWVPAEQFLERGKDINAILRKNNQALEGSVEKLRAQMEAQSEKFDRFSQYHDESEKRIYERAVADVESRKAAALADEDVVAYQQADHDAQSLVKPVETVPAVTEQQPDPAFAGWLANNSWYADSPEARIEADNYGTKLQGSGMTSEQFYAAVSGHMKTKMPELFGQSRSRQTTVETGGGVPDTGKKSYSDLPADAKAQCKNLVEDGTLSQDQYVKDYYGSV